MSQKKPIFQEHNRLYGIKSPLLNGLVSQEYYEITTLIIQSDLPLFVPLILKRKPLEVFKYQPSKSRHGGFDYLIRAKFNYILP